MYLREAFIQGNVLQCSCVANLLQVNQLQVKVSEMVASRDKLRGVVRKLKDDRTHYRTLAEQTQ